MDLEWKIKRFEALTTVELYDLLQLRSEVFVVEQNCVYQDIDYKDQKALHLTQEIQRIAKTLEREFYRLDKEKESLKSKGR